MTRYLLNSAVLPGPGDYRYRLITHEQARTWLHAGPFVSRIGYAETAAAMQELYGIAIPVDRRTVALNAGDAALVFRLNFAPGTQRVPPGEKGALSLDFVLDHCEVGLLERTA